MNIQEGTVKLPSKKIMDEICDFILLSYLRRNKYKIPKDIKTVSYNTSGVNDKLVVHIPVNELPYGLTKPLLLILMANYGQPEADAVVVPNEDHENIYIIIFYMKSKNFTIEKDMAFGIRHKIETTLSHELTHIIQNSLIVDKGEGARIKSKMMKSRYEKGATDYLTSPTEFESYIRTVIDNFCATHSKFSSKQSLNQAVVKYINGNNFLFGR
jgi:hypothetical protein